MLNLYRQTNKNNNDGTEILSELRDAAYSRCARH